MTAPAHVNSFLYSRGLPRLIISLAVAGIGIVVGATRGESRSVQCQKVGDVVNQAASQTSATTGFGTEALTQAADELAVLELGDDGLSNLRSHLVVSYREMAESSVAMASLAGEDGSVTFDASSSSEQEAIMTQFETTARDFSSKFNALQTYCNGGTVASELVDSPAQ